MKKGLFHHFVILAAALLFFAGVTASPADRDILFRENFENLDRWNALTFPRIESHTRYSIVREGETSLLKAESRGSASALVQDREFNVYESPVVRWRWKVDLFSVMAAPTEKAGDDYRRAFGADPPAVAGIAIMSDTDDGVGSAVAYIDYIEVGR